jgi:hypothetical protein
MKTGPDSLGTAKMCPGAQNLETSPDGLDTAQKESDIAKHENDPRRPRYRQK